MSATVPARDPVDLQAVLAQIDRAREETLKFTAEQHKLMAEPRKYNRDPWMLIAGAIIAGAFARLPDILHAFGLG